MLDKDKDLKFRPLGAKILIEKYKEVKKDEYVPSTAGLFIPQQEEENLKFKRTSGKVLKLGTGVSEDVKDNIKVGTTATFGNAKVVTYKSEDYYLVDEKDIQLILEDDPS